MEIQKKITYTCTGIFEFEVYVASIIQGKIPSARQNAIVKPLFEKGDRSKLTIQYL